jgi:glucan phosphoethanolaminetransferase (alkaline phosphatase superfamily)
MRRIVARPRALGVLLAPTALSFVIDALTRGRSLAEVIGTPTYAASVLLSAGLWALPLWLVALLSRARSRPGLRGAASRAGVSLLFFAWLMPLCIFAFAGQALYHRVFHAYMARDTVRFGIAQRAIVGAWFEQVGGAWSFVVLGSIGAALAVGFVVLVRRARLAASSGRTIAPALAFVLTLALLWNDAIETRGLQSALPDVCFTHGAVNAAREALRGKQGKKREISMRTPARLPALPQGEHRPNVLLVITESVRADALCSEPRPDCTSRFLDVVAPDRIAVGNLTALSPGTISSCVSMWTGLGPDADYTSVHAAPTLWELAHGAGYRTAYVSAQNVKNSDFGVFLARAGIDVRVSGSDLGGIASDIVGAPDERATERTLEFVRDGAQPWFAITHLSNTHSPYRTVRELEPNLPESMVPLAGTVALHNRYKNSVLLQERTIASFLGELRKLPAWDDTVVIFVSDHGEQFGEHGGLYHLHTIYEEEIRVPGFVVAGPRALDDAQRAALRTFEGERTYLVDVSATVVDLLGLWDARSTLPFASRVHGRSLLRRRAPEEPVVYLSISSAVWEADGLCRGLMQGKRVLIETRGGGRDCYDLAADPGEQHKLPAAACGALDASLAGGAW